MTKTYIDTGVLIAAFQGQHNLWAQAIAVLDDANREFVRSDFVRLETLPKPVYERRNDEVEFLEAFFESATIRPEVNPNLIENALDIAKVHGIAGMDSLHLAAARSANVEEFVTTEKPTKPMFRLKEIKLTSLHNKLPPEAHGT